MCSESEQGPFAHSDIHAVAYGVFNAAEKKLGAHACALALVRWEVGCNPDKRTLVFTFKHRRAKWAIECPESVLSRTDMFGKEWVLAAAEEFAAWLLLQMSSQGDSK